MDSPKSDDASAALCRNGGSVVSALTRPWWINVYPDGAITDGLCRSRDNALDRCTWSSEPLKPDAEQIEVRIVPSDKFDELTRDSAALWAVRQHLADYLEPDNDVPEAAKRAIQDTKQLRETILKHMTQESQRLGFYDPPNTTVSQCAESAEARKPSQPRGV